MNAPFPLSKSSYQLHSSDILSRIPKLKRISEGRYVGCCVVHNDNSLNHDNLPVIRDRAGWWRDYDGKRIYLFNAPGLREALKGFDFSRALDVLQETGVLHTPDSKKERAKPTRVSIGVKKLYHIQMIEG